MYFLLLQKLQIKYDWKELAMGNNFAERIFLRFKMDLELKYRELL
jgi:hypothetical protein